MWHCPLCRKVLQANRIAGQNASLSCDQGHCYDIAKEGYVNLLPPNRKHSQNPGDSPEMIAARARVHDAGLFQSLAEALQEQVACLDCPPSKILDLGCGEGFYGAALQRELPAARLMGIDIAKQAVRLAARRYSSGAFAVASAFDVPLADSNLDLILSVFAPVDPQEVSRLLAPSGIYLKVTPASQHLWELRQFLYDDAKPHPMDSQLLEGFEVLTAADLQYTRDLDGETLRDLVAMTPYAHRGAREGRDELAGLDALTVQMSFNISVQRRL